MHRHFQQHLQKGFILLFLVFTNIISFSQTKTAPTSIARFTEKMDSHAGFFNFHWDDKKGIIWLEIDKLDTEFLYVNSLAAGIGSNDIGLDRGQLGGEHVVKFSKSGNKILLTHINYNYRAVSDNADERISVEQAFAQSVLWGFKINVSEKGKYLVDATSFFLRDAHHVSGSLSQSKQGEYKLDRSRSAMYLGRTKNFPKNTEFEAALTFTGNPKGDWIRSVTPSPDAITVRQHHSFIELPSGYEPREFDPRCGFIPIKFADYATPITEPLEKRYIIRHRLEKKNPTAAVSEAVEPIIYYLDRGAPEPIKSALMEGAAWWNQAFEAAGFKNAFQVKELPAEADPMDVRYNLIQWVHRSTRGWSYGSSINDPRTGEILKGHVSLGSLRVRQDFLIAQGLISGYAKDGKTPDPRLLEMALARLRQLSAHEVGHTIGLTHNFAASTNGRSSVMDYPHPYITLDENGNMNFANSYDDKIGTWDKQAITYGYADFPEGTDEKTALQQVLAKNAEMGLRFISDQDARPAGGAHPFGHLWDNGISAPEELRRMIEVRRKALANFSLENISEGLPVAHLENVLVPIYLSHRYQVEAVSKLIGGVYYEYSVNETSLKNQKTPIVFPVMGKEQFDAMLALGETLKTEFLALPENILNLIPPQPMGYSRDQESFKTHTSMIFDPMAAAESSANKTIKFWLNPQRLARVLEQSARREDSQINLQNVFEQLYTVAFSNNRTTAYEKEIARIVEKLAIRHTLRLAAYKKGNEQVRAMALYQVNTLEKKTTRELANEKEVGQKEISRIAHLQYLLSEIANFRAHPHEYKLIEAPKLPAGSPIGCGH